MAKLQEDVYEGMKVLREDFDCVDENLFILPTTKEMFGDDLLEERFLELDKTGSNNAKDAAYYSKGPFSTELGYHPDKKAFVLKLDSLVIQDYMFKLNQIDGDTFDFNLKYTNDNNKNFSIGENTYSGFKDYCKKNNLGSTFKVRSAFINTPEIPHFEIQPVPKGSNSVKTMTLAELKKIRDKTNTGEVTYLKYKTNKKDSVSERDPNELINVYEKEVNGKKYYYEIIDKGFPSGAITTQNEKYNYFTIVSKDESEKNTLLGGYKAQEIAKKYLQNGTSNNDIYIVLDAGTITANKTTGNDYSFNNWWYSGDAIKGLIKDWKTALNDVSFSNLDYSPYGVDKYGRFLGTIYLKNKSDDSWINLSKLMLTDDGTNTEHLPDYTGSPELESLGENISDALQGWTYDKNNYRYVDLYSDMQEAYDRKLALHEELTGINFKERKDCTVMIGDVLLAIPPTSIRNSSVVTYEKKNILRGKGSMNKEQNREQILELDMYFYNDVGLNGIPYETTLPNGEKITYYMNGLRSLIAQFKVAPFLPIENGYINDVLCIEAVSLQSIQTMNVEGFPGLVRVVLTLRDFNYRVYMSDLPVDDEGMYDYVPPGKNDEDIRKEKKKEKNKNKNATKNKDEDLDIDSFFVNMFAKTIDWEVFRYYYQRAILKGETTSKLEYGSEEYLDMIYDNKNILQRADVCKSDVSFYVPDQEWLDKALEVKKDRDSYKESLTKEDPLDDIALKYMNQFSDVADTLTALNSMNGTGNQDKIPEYVKQFYKQTKDLLNADLHILIPKDHKDILRTNNTSFTKNTFPNSLIVKTYIKPIFRPLMDELEKSPNILSTTLDETIQGSLGKGFDITYTINCKLDESRLSREQANSIYEAIRNNGGADETVFKDGVLKINFSMKAGITGKPIEGSGSSNNYGSTNSLVLDSEGGYKVLQNIANQYEGKEEDGSVDSSTNDSQNVEMANKYQDFRNPKSMDFIVYIENAIATNFNITLENTFTQMYLKSVDGYAPQYTGAQDTAIELQFLTNDSVLTSLFNNLPSVSIQTVKKYRRILSSWPLRIKNSMLQMMGINEVLIEQAEVSTVEGIPGLYEINLRLISTDRTVREREALKKVGQSQTTDNDEYQIRQYFDMGKTLSKVDLYPDLDIPTIEELSSVGFEFSKYYLNNENDRAYPDPDFYIIYSHMYTSALIKKILKDSLMENLYGDNDKSKLNSSREYEDALGMKMVTGLETYKDNSSKLDRTKLVAKDANENAKVASKYAESAIKEINKNNEEQQKTGGNTERKDPANMKNILLYILACDVQKGWTIKNGWIATKCEKSTNDALRSKFEGSKNKGVKGNTKEETTQEDKEKINAYAEEINKRRKEAIRAIDAILDKKIKDANINEFNLEFESDYLMDNEFTPFIQAVENVFSGIDGDRLLKALCPLETSRKIKETQFWLSEKDNFTIKHKDVFLRYIVGFLYASACAISGAEAYGESKEESKWTPRFRIKNQKGREVPFAKVNNTIKNDTYARTKEQAFHEGVSIGPFLIKNYTRDEIIEILKYNPVYSMFKNDSLGEQRVHSAMYLKIENEPIYKDGLIDRYYNRKGWNSKEGREYRANVLFSPRYAAEAFLRIVLMHLRKLILEGVIISEIDVMAADFDSIKKELKRSLSTDDQYNVIATSATVRSKKENQALSNKEQMKDMIDTVIEEAPDSFKKSFCARMIYPFMSAITDADPAITEMILSENNSNLDAITSNPLTGQSKNSVFDKFMAALNGMYMFTSMKKNSDSSTSIAQRLISNYGKTIYLKASNDPRQYVMDSNFDMLVNDKRGRLVRAFPTYYLLFIDEGREIGLWRLFDNFYSMSAISDMTITKSRKNPTDVCTFSMNNMFDSYSDTYSDATTQTYMDTYGVKDVFDSIFSPGKYIEKEDLLRKRQILPDTTVMKPGVRTHVRIGYGSDASKLPIVFNGKIAEVANGDVMDIVAQGDGHELTNPLNAFGELEAKSLIESQQDFSIAKDLRGALSRGGLHPRELMAEILTAKHGGIWKAGIRYYSKGQFFNDNPFGIYHFGDHRFKDIFELGEPVQNLYEVIDDSALKDGSISVDQYNVFENKEGTNDMKSPIINTTLQDKTAWHVLEMCANSGLDYIGAIRDFGLRSTVFLGRPNDYYAYEYKFVDGKVVERRKPFQQFHYYNSYTDIVYNCITASEATMKTNAVGTWQSSAWLWGKEQETVGPIYLDMNIYPEYQKSMTVDTGLVASGNGGIDINAIQRFLEKTSLSSTKGNRVNKPLAEMITTNCLKNSVKDMYTGELCIIGDPTVKPYDRVGLDDTYEDMSGTFEVESVIHNINSDTGFTTTIIPDVIVKQNGSRETERMAYEKNMMYAFSVGVTTRYVLMTALQKIDSKVIKAVAKSVTLHGASEMTRGMFKKVSKVARLEKYITPGPNGEVLWPNAKKIIDKLNDVSAINLSEQAIYRSNQVKELFDLMSKSELEPYELKKLYNLANQIDLDDYKKTLEKIMSETNHVEAKKEIQALLNKFNDPDVILDMNISDIIGKDFDKKGLVSGLTEALKKVDKNGKDKRFDEIRKALKIIEESGADAIDGKTLEQIGNILGDASIGDLVNAAPNTLGKYVDDLGKTSLKFLNGEDGKKLSAMISKLFKNGVADDLLVDSSIFTALNPVTLAIEACKMLISFVISSNTKAMFNSWLKSIQALCVFPLQKNMRPLTAGMNGQKGSVLSNPGKDPYNSIQGMVIQGMEKISSNLFGSLILGGFVDTNSMDQILSIYKANLGIPGEEEAANIKEEKIIQNIQQDLSHECSSRAFHYNAVVSKHRIQSFDTNGGKSEEYKKYSIKVRKNKNQSIEDMKKEIAINERVLELYPIEDDPEIKKAVNETHDNVKKLTIAHSKSNKQVQVNFESGTRMIRYTQGQNSTVFDMPLLREDALFVLKKILSDKALTEKEVTFKSGVRVNSSKTWQNTGFRFLLSSNSPDALLKAVKSQKNKTKFTGQFLFNYNESDGGISICVYPQKSVKNIKDKDDDK